MVMRVSPHEHAQSVPTECCCTRIPTKAERLAFIRVKLARLSYTGHVSSRRLPADPI